MDEFWLRFLIRASVVVAVLLLIGVFGIIRSRSPRAKKWMLGALVGLVLLVVAYGFVRNILGKRYTPRGEEDVAEITALVQSRRGQIERVRDRLTALRNLVSRENWLPDGELTCPRNEEQVPLYFAFALRGAEHSEFGDPRTDLWDLDDLITWAGDPDTILETWREQTPEWLAAALTRSDAPLAIVVELTSVVPPEVRDLRFAADGTVDADIVAGRVRFRLGIVETPSGTVVAHGKGEARSRPDIKISGAADQLLSDLRAQTVRAAIAKGRALLQDDR